MTDKLRPNMSLGAKTSRAYDRSQGSAQIALQINLIALSGERGEDDSIALDNECWIWTKERDDISIQLAGSKDPQREQKQNYRVIRVDRSVRGEVIPGGTGCGNAGVRQAGLK